MASDLTASLARLRVATEPTGPDASERAWEALQHRVVQRRQRRRAAGLALAVCALVGVFAASRLRSVPVARPDEARLRDGSTVAALDGEARWRTLEQRADSVRVSLDRGAVRFDVARNPARRFTVFAGATAVEVLGTAFEVSRAGDTTRVQVLRGHVAVRRGDARFELTAGESITLRDRAPTAPAAPPPPDPASVPATPDAATDAPARDAAIDAGFDDRAHGTIEAATDAREPVRRDDWRSLARSHAWRAAQRALDAASLRDVRDTTDDLLLAADVASHAGRVGAAVSLLGRVVDGHPDDPSAGRAAAELGDLLLDALHDPRGAARAYATAHARGHRLTERQRMREVDALWRSGDRARARSLVDTLTREHPGPEVDALRARLDAR